MFDFSSESAEFDYIQGDEIAVLYAHEEEFLGLTIADKYGILYVAT